MVVQHRVDEAAQHFGGGEAVGLVTDDEVDEAVASELVSFGVAGFDDAVDVEQQPVTGLELLAASRSALSTRRWAVLSLRAGYGGTSRTVWGKAPSPSVRRFPCPRGIPRPS
ncbi:hypothetical protein GCM10010412_099540 [Nonomuraea recticatena]|uniref:Uncharacterized protein n=1 Tax=Nonomuraea recticatena TaxID=46178 RepID=A0ABN3TF94_9ACTN